MAEYTFTLKAIDSTVLDGEHPNTKFYNASSVSYNHSAQDTSVYDGPSDKIALLKFESIPTKFRKKKIYSVESHLYGYSRSKYYNEASFYPTYFYLDPAQNDVPLSDATWNKRPSETKYYGFTVGTTSTKEGWQIGEDSVNKYSGFLKTQIFYINGYYGDFLYSAQWKLYTAKSSYVPYLVFYAEDYVPVTKSHYPTSGFINKKIPNIFQWEITQTSSVDDIGQKSAVFRWRETGQSTIHALNVTGSKTEITVPANTFTGNSIQWQVQVTSDDNITGVMSDWMTLTTADSVPSAFPVSPVDAYVDGSKDALFRWRHSVSTGTPQSRYELQYSSDSGQTWIDLASDVTTQTSTIIPADTFPAGRLIWRVRTANSEGVWSNWSSPANIIVRAAPQQPVLGVSRVSPRPLFAWQSTGQSSWRLAIFQNGEEIYDTGEVPGDDKRFQMPEYLPNGSYEARLWVKNLYELQSQAAVVSFAIAMEEVPSPELEVQAKENKALLSISGGGFTRYYIFRDDVMVHKIYAPGVWEDYAACGNHTYWVRGVMSNDTFADSNRVHIWVPVLFAQLSDTEDLSHPISLKCRRGEYPLLEGEIMPQGKSTFFAGRQYPLYEFAENLSEPLSMSFSYRNRKDFEKLAQMVKERRSLLYRDYRGERRYLAVTGIRYTVGAVSWDFSLSTERVDYVEAISYDPPEEAEE